MTALQAASQVLFPLKGANESADAFLTRLLPSLNALAQLVASMSAGTATIYDTSGRPIVTPAGNYAYGIDGSTVVAPDIVQIDTQDIVDAAVGEDQVAALAIGTAKIKDAAIVTAKIGDLAVVSAKIDDLAVNNAKIANVSAGKLTAGTIGTNAIYVGGSQFELDGTNTVLKIKDTQGSPVTRVELGKLGAGSTAYGLTIRDSAGGIVFSTGASTVIAGTYIDALAANKIAAGTLAAGVVYAGTINVGQLNAGTLTAFTLQTASSGQRVVVDSSINALRAYDSSGNTIAQIGGSGGTALGSVYSTSAALLNLQNGGSGQGAFIISTGESAVFAANTSATHAAVAGQCTGGDFAFYSLQGGYGPFTGAHEGLVRKDVAIELGDLSRDTQIVARCGWSDSIAEVVATDEEAVQIAVGVVVARSALTTRTAAMRDLTDEEFQAVQSIYDRVLINAVGEGLISTCGRGGNISAGDLLVSSAMTGKVQRQGDDVVRACTIAKAREPASFEHPDDVRAIACFYCCG